MAGLAAKVTALINTLKAEGRPLFDKFMFYAKVELAPPTPGDLMHLRKTAEAARCAKDAKAAGGRIGQMTVAQAWLNTLVTIEVITWFFIGECIGRRHLVGYNV